MATLKHFIATLSSVFTVLVLVFDYLHDYEQNPVPPSASQQTHILSSHPQSLGYPENVWRDSSGDAKRAVTAIKAELDKIDLNDAYKHIEEIPAEIQAAVGQLDITAFEAWLLQTTKTGLKDAVAHLQAIRFEDLPAEALQYVEDHPVEAACYVIETVAFFVPGGVYGPLLRALGFTRLGVKARSIAALIQSKIGARVPARSWFAHLVSAAMGGYGKKVLDSWTRVGLKAGGWLGWLLGRDDH